MPDGSPVSQEDQGGADLGRPAEELRRAHREARGRAQARSAATSRDVYSEAKGVGYDVKTMRKIVSLRKMDAAERDEQEALLDIYKHALGMV